MAYVGNLALQTTQTQGAVAAFSLDATVPQGFQSWVAALTAVTGDAVGPWSTYYYVEDDQDFECGIATLTKGSGGGADTLLPVTVEDSSNGGSRVVWGAGTRNVVLDATAGSLSILNGVGPGLIARTAQDAYAERTITPADANQMTVTDGDGGAGNPTIGLKGLPALGASDEGKVPAVQSPFSGGFSYVDVTRTFKNLFINGSFDIWQRGTSFTATDYTADRWRADFSDGSGTASQQSHVIGQTTVPGNPRFFHRHAQTGAPTGANTGKDAQRIENVETLAGLTIAVSGYFQDPTGAKTFTIRARQHFGTGGSPSADVTTLVGSMNVTTTFKKFTETVALPSVSGKTRGTNGDDYLEIFIEGPAAGLYTLDMSELQIEEGGASTSFDKRPKAFEFPLCLRYFWKSFPQSVAPAQNAGTAGAIRMFSASGATENAYQWVQTPTMMRIAPTVTTYNPSAANADWRDLDAAVDRAAEVLDISESGFYIRNTVTMTGLNNAAIHATASAEL